MDEPSPVQVKPAELWSTRSYQVPKRLIVTEWFFEVPLDHSDQQRNPEQIRIFCRSARRFDSKAPTAYPIEAPRMNGGDVHSEAEVIPWFVYIPGGPGFGAPMPQDMIDLADEVVGRGYQLLCFDHRGMGLSTPASASTILDRGSPEDQAAYLRLFRADNAVRDLEAIRLYLTENWPPHLRQWSVMGASYGGFVCLTYLSLHPEGLREVFPVAGMAPITQTVPDAPLKRLFQKVYDRNQQYYQKYPADIYNVRRVVDHLNDHPTPVYLPCGDVLDANRFLEMGLHFGFHGGMDKVAAVVLRAHTDVDVLGYLTRPTLAEIESMSTFNEHPLYALLHGAIYAQGRPSNWAFDRVLAEFGKFQRADQHDYDDHDQTTMPPLFTGEMVFRDAFDGYGELELLLEVADLLERDTVWPALYDLDRLRANTVPVYAAIYVDDMYVDFDFARETAAIIKNCKTFVTSMFYHDALRTRTGDVLKSLFALKDDTLD